MTQEYPISISILEHNGGYRVVASTEDDGDFIFSLPFDKNGFDNINTQIQNILSEIVGRLEYNEIDIEENLCKNDLWKIASLDLFKQIFLGYKPEPDAEKFVELLKELSQKYILNIKIVTENFFIPWGLFYDGELSPEEGKVDYESFWGFKHQINLIPAPGKRWKFGSLIDTIDFKFSFNANEDIDKDYHLSCIPEQNEYFDQISNQNFKKIYRSQKDELLDALKQDNFNDDLIYFYCHAKTISKPAVDSFFELTGKNRITLHDLKTFYGNENFVKQPLVFLNACESAQMNPLFYDGFLPYFMSKGSRGLIGTISTVPATFASKFALAFFDLFLKGEKLGVIMPKIRKKFLEKNKNPLGLIYQAYCNANVRLTHPILN